MNSLKKLYENTLIALSILSITTLRPKTSAVLSMEGEFVEPVSAMRKGNPILPKPTSCLDKICSILS